MPTTVPKPVVKIETITPKAAEKFLTTNSVNRAIRKTLVQKYANIMLAGEWHLNGESVKLDWDGNLMDGQHRLMAVIEADVPQEFVVVRNLPPDTRSTIDIGARRSLADWLKMSGEADSINLATALNFFWRFTVPEDPRIKQSEYPTYHQAVEYLDANSGLRDVLHQWKARFYDITGRMAMMCALIYWFEQVDRPAAEEFADLLWSGAGLPKGSPILVLRRALANDRRDPGGSRASSVNIAALVIKAFNYWRTDRPSTVLSWREKAEEFPRPMTKDEVNHAKATLDRLAKH